MIRRYSEEFMITMNPTPDAGYGSVLRQNEKRMKGLLKRIIFLKIKFVLKRVEDAHRFQCGSRSWPDFPVTKG
jgi:hypothetical protein